MLIPKQLVNEVIQSLHKEFVKHPGITKTINAYRENYCSTNMAELTRDALGHVSNALENQGLIVNKPAFPCKTRMSTLLRQKTLCNLIWCRDYLGPVFMKSM